MTNIKSPESILSGLIFLLYFPSPSGHSDLECFAEGLFPTPALRVAHSGLSPSRRRVGETDLHHLCRKQRSLGNVVLFQPTKISKPLKTSMHFA